MGTAAGNKKLRSDRRERGLCSYLGCETKSGRDYRCPKHAAAHAAKMKRQRRGEEAAA